jgi:iron complex transport system substrate-binding protein
LEKPLAATLAAFTIIVIIIAAEFAVLENRLNSLETLVKEQNKKLGDINETLSNQGEEISEQGETISNIQKEVSEQAKQIHGLNETIHNVRVEIESGTKLLQERINDTQIEINTIKKQVSKLSMEMSRLTGYPRTVVDFTGQTVVIQAQPERVVSLAPSITEIIFALGEEDKLVGVDQYSNYPPKLLELEKNGYIEVVGGFTNPSYEKIVSLKPDVVFTVSGVQLQVAHRLRTLGLNVVVLGSKDMNQVVGSIITIGKVLGADDKAAKLAANVTRDLENLASISSRINTTPKVAVIVWNNPIFVAGKESFINSLIEMAGGINAFYNYTQSYPMIGPEDLVAANPDVIIFTEGSGVSNYTQAIQWLKSLPGGNSLTAVKTGSVYVLHGGYSDMMIRPSVRSPAAGILLLGIIHPETGSNMPHDVSPSTWSLLGYVNRLESTYNLVFILPLMQG